MKKYALALFVVAALAIAGANQAVAKCGTYATGACLTGDRCGANGLWIKDKTCPSKTVDIDKPRQKSPPTGVETKQPATRERKLDKATPQLTKVKVLEVNDTAKTVTVMVKGKTFTFDAKNLKLLPKPGDFIGMRDDPTGDPTPQKLVCRVMECDMGFGSGPCIRCFDFQTLPSY